ncbi:zinc/manganese transport system ATP-binding protein [Microbacterium proteolyticum]|uniref:Zinc/manganese transport system ATP-binding protein n=1 Tax=Microbacterium proteolyticum TaxID=1572644 RepID=A0A7W5CKY2_9MICO|nr:zinc ABC transporter ATP-binding protein AztA [Microbacterium proteolyticum]MBB3159224.1 zinc/manganese transport system ATP-binding protein [Microbacterium proteolyticum]
MPPLAIVARALTVDFGGTVALDGVDVDIPAGSLTVIVGPNGAGKSTLLEVLAGAREPSAGSVDVGAHSRAFVPQRADVSEHLPLTVRDVVSVGAWGRTGALRRIAASDRAAIDTAMQRLDIAPLARHPFASLSGGQRQRALLAQGLARRAGILLLDEPTTGLDAASAERNRAAAAHERARGATVVCVSHDDRLVSDADHVVELDAGRVQTTHASLDDIRAANAPVR